MPAFDSQSSLNYLFCFVSLLFYFLHTLLISMVYILCLLKTRCDLLHFKADLELSRVLMGRSSTHPPPPASQSTNYEPVPWQRSLSGIAHSRYESWDGRFASVCVCISHCPRAIHRLDGCLSFVFNTRSLLVSVTVLAVGICTDFLRMINANNIV